MILVSCQPSVDNNTDGETQDNNSASVGDGPINSENNKEDDINVPEDNENIGENDSDVPENEENSDSGEEKDENTTPLPEIGTKVGNRFADVTLETMNGGSINTADLRGKIVILNIWATRCPPCKAELPDFNIIASEYADEIVIIAAHDYYGKAGATNYVAENFPDTKIIFAYDTVYSDAYTAAGGDGYIPFTAILDKNGVIVYSDSGMLSYERLVGIIEQIKSQK